jgi:hypothetical protein
MKYSEIRKKLKNLNLKEEQEDVIWEIIYKIEDDINEKCDCKIKSIEEKRK